MDDKALRAQALAALEQIKQKHIAHYGHEKGWVAKTAWRIGLSVTSINRYRIMHRSVSQETATLLTDFAALNYPFNYPQI